MPVQGVAAVFGRVQAPAAAEDDDRVGGLQRVRVGRVADFQRFLQQAAHPRGGQGVERGGGQQDQRHGQARAATMQAYPGHQQDHQHERRQQGGGDKIGDEPGGHGGDCMPAGQSLRRQCLTLCGVRS
jgi:hypothetical protein